MSATPIRRRRVLPWLGAGLVLAVLVALLPLLTGDVGTDGNQPRLTEAAPGGTSGPRERHHATAPGPTDAREPKETRREPDRGSTLPESWREDPGTLEVVVKHADGSVAAGIPVFVFLANEPLSPDGMPRLHVEKTTDESGRIEFAVEKHYSVRALARSGDSSARSDALELVPGADQIVELVLDRRASIDGYVTDDRGEVVAGAEILFSAAGTIKGPESLARCVTVVTDEHGRLRIPDLAVSEMHERAYVRVMAAGYMTYWAEPRRDDLLSRGLSVRLVKAGSVRGRIVDHEGRPLRAANLLIPESMIQARSDDDGRFEIAGLPPAGGTLIVSTASRGPRILKGLEGGDDVGDVSLASGVSISGTVVTEDGAPSPRAKMVVLRTHGIFVRSTRADSDGRFEFRGVGDGEYALQTMLHGGEGAAGDRAELSGVRPGATDLRLVLRPSAAFHVHLFSAEGEELWVRSVTLAATSGRGDDITANVTPRRSRRVHSHHVFVPPGAVYTVRVDAAGHEPAERTGLPIGKGEVKELEFRLQPDGSGDE